MKEDSVSVETEARGFTLLAGVSNVQGWNWTFSAGISDGELCIVFKHNNLEYICPWATALEDGWLLEWQQDGERRTAVLSDEDAKNKIIHFMKGGW